MLAVAGTAYAANILKVQDVELVPGESVALSIELDNETTNLMGWQCDIVLPEGLSLALKNNGKPIAVLGERFATTEHSISSSRLANGAYRFIATSMDGDAIPGTRGTLFSVTLQADASLAKPTYTGSTDVHRGMPLQGMVTNIEFNTLDNQKMPLDDVTINVSILGGKEQKCATPTISYVNGKLVFDCETEDVVFHSSITDTDIASYLSKEISLSATYTITVYATKAGYENSDVATATLCWIDQQPSTEGIVDEDAVTEIKALPVLIQAQAGFITLQGLEAGTEVSAYNTSGMLLDTIISSQDTATLRTKLPAGSTAIVNIGQRAVKVMVK